MPPIFKALVTVTAWLMFIFAWGCLLSAFIAGGIVGGWAGYGFFVGFAISVFFAFGGGFLLLVRKKLE